jgi:hypothetical protein
VKEPSPGVPNEIFAASRLEVLLIYEDFATGLRARQCLDHVLGDRGTVADIRLAAWRLDLFPLPEIREEAAVSARTADVVLMSLHGDSLLEPPLEQWLMHWIAQRGEVESALGVLFDADQQGTGPVNALLFRLQTDLRQSPVRLFVGFSPPSGIEEDFPLPQTPPGIEPLLWAGDDVEIPPDVKPHWGINE